RLNRPASSAACLRRATGKVDAANAEARGFLSLDTTRASLRVSKPVHGRISFGHCLLVLPQRQCNDPIPGEFGENHHPFEAVELTNGRQDPDRKSTRLN